MLVTMSDSEINRFKVIEDVSATDTSGRCCRDPQLECPSHPTPDEPTS
ncbi:hypothetical protein M565_ctg1P0957 [Vibrio cyclitrophicus FF75]|nr:hypothetical protein M565_ctg1P0957 [Vibrio cyclitrophicus FF75]